MIAVKVTDADKERFVTNIITQYGRATVTQRMAGERWYVTANELAALISGGNARQGAGVLAALSANKSWFENRKIATRAFVEGKATGHVGDAIRKATAIMNGAAPESVLPMTAKTGNFYRCIADPTDSEAVCVDRHAHDIAVGEVYGNEERGLGAKGRYTAIADAYREAAKRLGVIPMVVQAVTWVVQVETLARTKQSA